MADINRGIDLSQLETITDQEAEDFGQFYERILGTRHKGLEFWIEYGRADVLKRYRAWADDQTPTSAIDGGRKLAVFAFLQFYALTGYDVGIRYQVHLYQRAGITRTQMLEGIAVAFLHIGPRGSETVARALEGYEWIEPERPAEFPDGWAPDPEAFRSGIDYTRREVLPGEMEKIRAWYERTLGEVPRYVDFLIRHRPQLLKSWRNRYENLLFELPKQVMPYTLLHWNVMRGYGPGIRENLLLGRTFGMTKDQVYEPLFSPLLNAGPEMLDLVDEVAGDILEADWPTR